MNVPGKTNISTANNTMPATSKRIASKPANPATLWPKIADNIRASPVIPSIPKLGVFISTTSITIPIPNKKGVRNSTTAANSSDQEASYSTSSMFSVPKPYLKMSSIDSAIPAAISGSGGSPKGATAFEAVNDKSSPFGLIRTSSYTNSYSVSIIALITLFLSCLS